MEILGCLPAVVPALLSLMKLVLLRNVGWDLPNEKLIDWRWRLGLGLFQRWFWVHLIWSSVWEGLVRRALTFVKGRQGLFPHNILPERYFEADLIYLQWLEGGKKEVVWVWADSSMVGPFASLPASYPAWFLPGSSSAEGVRGKKVGKEPP